MQLIILLAKLMKYKPEKNKLNTHTFYLNICAVIYKISDFRVRCSETSEIKAMLRKPSGLVPPVEVETVRYPQSIKWSEVLQ
jgi:hypothetical protein